MVAMYRLMPWRRQVGWPFLNQDSNRCVLSPKKCVNRGVAVPEDFETEGILEMDDHYVLIVPAHVVAEPRSTVGMGDTISSSSFSYEWNKKKIGL